MERRKQFHSAVRLARASPSQHTYWHVTTPRFTVRLVANSPPCWWPDTGIAARTQCRFQQARKRDRR